ncbi:MAG: hypothetical protein PF444_00505 [Bacteroidales bacterium]|jgi:hypothetical protein|nr:hypothetical protein [Bacteroidales bacterium]
MRSWFTVQNFKLTRKGDVKIRRGTDDSVRLFTLLEYNLITPWLNGATGYGVLLSDSSINGINLTQIQNEMQPIIDVDNGVIIFSGAQTLETTNPRDDYYSTKLTLILGEIQVRASQGLVAISDNDGRRNDVYLQDNNTKLRVFWKKDSGVSYYGDYVLIDDISYSEITVESPSTGTGVPTVIQNGKLLSNPSIRSTTNRYLRRIVLGQINAFDEYNSNYALSGEIQSVKLENLLTGEDIFNYNI